MEPKWVDFGIVAIIWVDGCDQTGSVTLDVKDMLCCIGISFTTDGEPH